MSCLRIVSPRKSGIAGARMEAGEYSVGDELYVEHHKRNPYAA